MAYVENRIVHDADSHLMELTDCLDALDRPQLDRAADAAKRLRDEYDWGRLAESHFELLEEVGTAKL